MKSQQKMVKKSINKICTLLRFYEELVKFFIGPKVLVIRPFCFLGSNIYFDFFDNLVQALF